MAEMEYYRVILTEPVFMCNSDYNAVLVEFLTNQLYDDTHILIFLAVSIDFYDWYRDGNT